MISFYVLDCFDSVDKFVIYRSCVKKREKVCTEGSPLEKHSEHSRTVVCTDPIELHRFLVELYYFQAYRLRILNAVYNFVGGRPNCLVIKLHSPGKQPLDYKWGERANRMIWERIETDEMMSWLSTLGGAFSALGDYKLDCANIAGRISIQQMKFAMRVGEPSLIARCKLYLAIAMIQRYNFAGAKQMVVQIYRTEKHQYEPDTRLLKMCLGIWAKLKYEYELYQKRLNRPKEHSHFKILGC
ncbi:uncharacterized protein F58A4.6 [Sabethes cyaneus]|uniref:uncharacterized protein F58A4.6 n=1 Tax=Sabethes cyaneus TaxID=53552 RepID=UPI00237D900D|nr:uncharacterized protein F58A4.6 [Sabethes cyaneus]